MRRLFLYFYTIRWDTITKLTCYCFNEWRDRVYRAKSTSPACKPIRSKHAIAYGRCFVYIKSIDILDRVQMFLPYVVDPYSFQSSSRNQDNVAWRKSTCRRVFPQETWSSTRAVTSPRFFQCYWAHDSRINEKMGLNYSAFIKIFSSKIVLLWSKLPAVICLIYNAGFSWLVDSNLWVTQSSDSKKMAQTHAKWYTV
jgi:hypothetical protein